MRTRRLLVAAAVGAMLTAGLAVSSATAGARTASAVPPSGPQIIYVVLADDGGLGAARRTVAAAGGTVVAENAAVGALTVAAPSIGFIEAVGPGSGIAGVARNRSIGNEPGMTPRPDLVEKEGRGSHGARPASRPSPQPGRPGHGPGVPSGTDTFESRQWDMQMIHADVARTIDAGSPRVLVGVMDTGIDASNPDLAPNFDAGRSRNFVTDMPDIDGPCEAASCHDPANADDGGHGTHVAGTIAAAANGMGIVGVAPNVRLVNVRAGQDSGYFFLGATLDALTYSGDIGVDVVNMSFYVDPWLFNCASNPADSPEAQQEQRTIVAAMNRALDYAHAKGVTLVSAMGNGNSDLGKPGIDYSSPDYPFDAAYPRTIDNATCLSMPGEGNHVVNVTSVGPSKMKADYSDYGLERAWVAAPGGWFRDGFGTPTFRTNENLILSTYPLHVLQEEGTVDQNGDVVPDAEGLVYKDCTPGGVCGYYTYLQGTSMAAPHATGLAALAVGRFGHPDGRRGGLTLQPDLTARVVAATATPTPCPVPPLKSYAQEGRDPSYDALCEGTTAFNGFYGAGIIDAERLVRRRGIGS